MRLFTLFTLIFIALSCTGQSNQKPDFNIGNGDFVVRDIAQLVAVSPDGNGLKFEFKGNPLTGESISQDFRFSANSISGSAAQIKSGKARIERATMSGNLVFIQPRKGPESLKVSTESATYQEPINSSPTLTIPGAFTVKQTEPGGSLAASGADGLAIISPASREIESFRIGQSAKIIVSQKQGGRLVQQTFQSGSLSIKQTASGSIASIPGNFTFQSVGDIANSTKKEVIEIKASSGEFHFLDLSKPLPSGKRPLRSAMITGPVDLTLNTLNAAGEAIHIEASGSRLTFEESGVVALTGDIKIRFSRDSADSPIVYNGTGESDRIEITLTSDNKLQSWKVTGGPAKLKVEQSTGGG